MPEDRLEDLPGYEKPKHDAPAGRRGKVAAVSNKSAAAIQITAEQILREAHEYKELTFKAPRQKITDKEELEQYRMGKRKDFEDNLRRQRENIGSWRKYAEWEASQKEFDRARSIFERALDVDYRNPSLWLKYAEMEMKNKFINHARNIWDRAVALLPRHDQFWMKYAHMEEMLNNVVGARQVYERWMQWQPEPSGWNLYVKLEMRHKNPDKARDIFERFIVVHNEVDSYLKYAKWEERFGDKPLARRVLERAMTELGDDANDPGLFIHFAKFEERMKETDRARVIYKYALDHVPKHKAEGLYKMYTSFEKQHGHREGVEDVILSKRRFQYEEQLKSNPRNYDTWFDYIRLEESGGDRDKIRTVFERSIANVPPIREKKFWERYIYLWINFALYEELVANDQIRTEKVYELCERTIPHSAFTFPEIWIMHSNFYIRQKKLDLARKLLGKSIGLCPRERVFKHYIELELQLGNVPRCRKLYEKYLEFMPENCSAWAKYAELESSLGETERARGIFELAVQQPVLDMPEVLWKAYIDFEMKHKQHDRTRLLYKRLLDRTKHVKVWVSRAQFEASIKQPQNARPIFKEAETFFAKQPDASEERVMLLEAWRDFERVYGTDETRAAVSAKMPRRVKKKRQIKAEDGTEAGWEEYWDYIFPGEEGKQGTLKILEMARNWKKAKIAT